MSTPYPRPIQLGRAVPGPPLVAYGRRRRPYYLGAPPPPDPTERWVITSVNIFKTLADDLAKLWNYVVTPSTPTAAIPMPVVGETVSALGVGQSAYSIATQGPSPQNVGGLTIGLARLWEGGKQLLGIGSATQAAGEAAGAAGAAGSAASIIGPAASILGMGLTAYQLADDPSPGAALGLATSATYTAGYAASTAGLSSVAAGAAALGPALAVVSLPFILGSILDPIFRATGFTHRAAHFPGGYIGLPGDWGGDGRAAVDPSTGRILIWSGKTYYWADQTQAGLPATPEQFAEWGIQPTGTLATRPGYRDVTKFRDEAVMAKLQGTTRGAVPPDVLQSYFMEQRAPAIQALHASDPEAAAGEIWRQYTLTPEYQEEVALQGALSARDDVSDH